MIKPLLTAAALAVLVASTPATAQSAQERLDERYNLALAAGYKALFMCSAIANAEANGATRTPESVHEWELSGIYPVLDPIIRDLPYEIRRHEDGTVWDVRVSWAEDMEPRIAATRGGGGCFIHPIASDGNFASAQFFDGETLELAWPSDDGAFSEEETSALQQGAFEGGYGEGARTTAVVVVKDDAIAMEHYADGFGPNVPQRTWSVAKSIAATIVGAAVQRGEADVTAPTNLFEEIGDPRDALTIDHFLRMASGRYSDTRGNRTDPLYWGGTSVSERALNWPLLHAPGTVYRYANNDTLMAIMAIEDTLVFDPPAALFQAIGMSHTVAEQDWQGHYVLSSQVWATARDLAALGQLHVDNGVMPDGTRILPDNWVEYISSPSGPQPNGPFGYGAGWWLLNNSEGIPSDTFGAFGNRGQYVIVVPSRNVVIVRRGEDRVGTRFDIAAFTRDVLAALEE